MNIITMKREWHYLYKVKVIKELDEFSVDGGHLCVRPWQIRPLRDSNEREVVKELLDIPTIVENTFATL